MTHASLTHPRLSLSRGVTVSWTPLHCAVSNGEIAACKQLTEAGADPARKDAEGKSSMDLARHFGNNDVRERALTLEPHLRRARPIWRGSCFYCL